MAKPEINHNLTGFEYETLASYRLLKNDVNKFFSVWKNRLRLLISLEETVETYNEDLAIITYAHNHSPESLKIMQLLEFQEFDPEQANHLASYLQNKARNLYSEPTPSDHQKRLFWIYETIYSELTNQNLRENIEDMHDQTEA